MDTPSWTPKREDQSPSATQRSIHPSQTGAASGTHVHDGVTGRKIPAGSIDGLSDPRNYVIGGIRFESADTSLGSGVAAGATGNLVITFPKAFTSVPVVTVSSSNSRVNVAVGAVTLTNFTASYANWTAAATAGVVHFFWQAVGNK